MLGEEKQSQEKEHPEALERAQSDDPSETPSGEESPEQTEEVTPSGAEEAPAMEPDAAEEEELSGVEQPPLDVAGPEASPDRSDDESEAARIAREAAEGAAPDQPLPETEQEMEQEVSPEEPSPGGEPEKMVTPEPSLPESGVEIEEMAEEAAEVEEEAEEAEESAAIETPRKPSPTRAVKKVAGLPGEDEAEQRWYVIHAHSGHENKVRQSLENRVRQEHLEHLVSQVLIPTEEVAEVKGGKKRITSRKIYPGYVMVEMKLTHKTWHLIRTTAGVTGFIGSGKMPTPLESEEVESIFEQMRGEQKKPKPKVSFEKDEKVKIIEGPFTNFMGYVDDVNPERGKLKVMVEIFERLTSVELEFWQVEKV